MVIKHNPNKQQTCKTNATPGMLESLLSSPLCKCALVNKVND